MEIDHVYRSRLTNALHLQFNGEARDPVEKFPNVAARMAPQFDVFRQSVEREDACFKIIRQSDLSALPHDGRAPRNRRRLRQRGAGAERLIVMEGEAACAPFVAELNELAKHCHTPVTQREGRNRKKSDGNGENSENSEE
jgi:hypothetical protein